jgi:hypothetical protein
MMRIASLGIGAGIAAMLLAASASGQQNAMTAGRRPSAPPSGAGITAAVIRTATFNGGTPFGCTEDTSTGEILFSEQNTPFRIEFRDKQLNLVRTLDIPNQGTAMAGIGYDAKHDTIWACDQTTYKVWEYNKFTAAATGAWVQYPGGLLAGSLTIDLNDGTGGDTLYIAEPYWDKIHQVNLRTGQKTGDHQNPLGQYAWGSGISYAANPAYSGELFITAGLEADGQVTDLFRGNPSIGQDYLHAFSVRDFGPSGDVLPIGFQSSIDPGVTPSEVFYYVGQDTNTIYEIYAPKTSEDCQGIDGENVLFVNGQNSPFVDLGEGWPFHFAIWKPSGGGIGRYLVHMNAGHPYDPTITTLPSGLGVVCFPMLLPPFGSASPVCVWNNVGKTQKIGASHYFGAAIPDPQPAPVFFHESISGDATNMPAGATFTLQGVILNPAASSPHAGRCDLHAARRDPESGGQQPEGSECHERHRRHGAERSLTAASKPRERE